MTAATFVTVGGAFGVGSEFAHFQCRTSVQVILRHKPNPHAPTCVCRRYPVKLLHTRIVGWYGLTGECNLLASSSIIVTEK